ncbi:MAG: hypothetical protein O7D30_07620 [Rickettsia endosymbiont of Ixodes persulcatus]|nr:hypothetical protein [Rickettsia endosymbiont of Ixodes persulcatus]
MISKQTLERRKIIYYNLYYCNEIQVCDVLRQMCYFLSDKLGGVIISGRHGSCITKNPHEMAIIEVEGPDKMNYSINRINDAEAFISFPFIRPKGIQRRITSGGIQK